MVISKDPNVMKRRATTVEYKSCGALLRNIYMEGGDIVGEIETLSGFHGPDIAKMVLYDKVNIGFSLRALGSVNTLSDGTIEVLTPIKPKNVMGLDKLIFNYGEKYSTAKFGGRKIKFYPYQLI